jgi:8-oxo-dGTP pyrophosphatase MutT (NUDIX family)
MKTMNRRVVAAHIVSVDNKVLFGRKLPGSGAVYQDYWHIPGGGVDDGETDEAAVKREVMEETSIDIRSARLSLIDDEGKGESEKTLENGEKVLVKMQFNIFKVEIDKPAAEIDVQESDDLIGFKWFSIDELQTIELTPPEKVLLKRLGTDWLYFGKQVGSHD